jgi:hypothetical protein
MHNLEPPHAPIAYEHYKAEAARLRRAAIGHSLDQLRRLVVRLVRARDGSAAYRTVPGAG